jgi:hypothetical protein
MANERGSTSGASGLADQIKQDGRQRIEQTKRSAAGHIESLAEALDSARARLDQDQPTLAAYAGRAATGVSNLATKLRDGNVEELLEDTRALARRNPALFLAGGVAIGFALSRFLKASADRAARYASEEGYRASEASASSAAGSEGVPPNPGDATQFDGG